MVFTVSKRELENFKNAEQLKRDLRPTFGLIDRLLESLEPAAVSETQPTLLLDLMECILCPEALQLQRTLEQYREQVGGRWACLAVHSRLAATSADWAELDPREARLLLLLSSQPGAPLRETCVFLPYTSPNVAFRAVTCKLLADVYVLVMCGATPTLAQLDVTVLRCWEHSAPLLRDARSSHPRNLPATVQFESVVLGVLIINIPSRKVVCSRSLHSMSQQKSRVASGAHRLDILRTFYVRAARDLAPELQVATEETDEWQQAVAGATCETYWCSEYHKCHAWRSTNLLCCALYVSTVPTHTMRTITTQIVTTVANNKEIVW